MPHARARARARASVPARQRRPFDAHGARRGGHLGVRGRVEAVADAPDAGAAPGARTPGTTPTPRTREARRGAGAPPQHEAVVARGAGGAMVPRVARADGPVGAPHAHAGAGGASGHARDARRPHKPRRAHAAATGPLGTRVRCARARAHPPAECPRRRRIDVVAGAPTSAAQGAERHDGRGAAHGGYWTAAASRDHNRTRDACTARARARARARHTRPRAAPYAPHLHGALRALEGFA